MLVFYIIFVRHAFVLLSAAKRESGSREYVGTRTRIVSEQTVEENG